MMPWDILDQDQIKSILPILKSFSEAWQYRKPEPSVVLGPELRSTQKTIARGKSFIFRKSVGSAMVRQVKEMVPAVTILRMSGKFRYKPIILQGKISLREVLQIKISI